MRLVLSVLLRGREGWTSLNKSHFKVLTDGDGSEYVTCQLTESTKNNQGGHKQAEQDYTDVRMYGEAVSIFKVYLTKLHPDCDRLFQTAAKSFRLNDECWFRKEPMGKTPLASMMQAISKKAGLSVEYTCHSVRASTVTTLFHSGVSARDICSITKHRQENSLKHYINDTSTEQK